MPSFYYFASLERSLEMLDELCGLGFRVIPNKLYSEPQVKFYDRVDQELVGLLTEGPGFYLAGPFTLYPPSLRRLPSGPAEGRYLVQPLTQGPLLQGLLGRCNIIDGHPTLLLGDLGYQAQYREPLTDRWDKASTELKTAYRTALSTMKVRLKKHDATGGFLTHPDALSLILTGKAKAKTTFTRAC